MDETRCLLPWPSNTFTVADPGSATGLKVSISARSLPVRDNPSSLNRADGFSVVTPLAVGFPAAVHPSLSGQKATSAVRLFNAQPGGEGFGSEVPLRLMVVDDGASGAALLLAYPMRPLDYATDYVAVVLDEVTPAAGGTFETPRAAQVALGLVAPASDDEKALAHYHAPTRSLLARVGVEARRALRIWDFTTRSAGNVSRPFEVMRAKAVEAVGAGVVEVQLTDATPMGNQSMVVHGQMTGLPSFLTDGGVLQLDEEGAPTIQGTRSAPFRAVLPAGAGAFPVVHRPHAVPGAGLHHRDARRPLVHHREHPRRRRGPCAGDGLPRQLLGGRAPGRVAPDVREQRWPGVRFHRRALTFGASGRQV